MRRPLVALALVLTSGCAVHTYYPGPYCYPRPYHYRYYWLSPAGAAPCSETADGHGVRVPAA